MSKKDTLDVQHEIEELKKMVEELKKNQKSHCSECGRPYVESAPIYPMPIYPYPVAPSIPYVPGTPIGPYWEWPYQTITVSQGTISNDLDLINFNSNCSDEGSTI